MKKATICGLSVLGVLVVAGCGGSDSPSLGSVNAGGASGSLVGAGGTGNAGSNAAGGGTSTGSGGFGGLPGTGGGANTGGFAGTLGIGGAPGTGGAPGGALPDAGIGIPPGARDAGIGIPPGARDAGIGNFNFDAAGFAFDASGFAFEAGTFGGAVACPTNEPNSGGFCFSANQSCPYGAVTCTCEPGDGGGVLADRWSCQ